MPLAQDVHCNRKADVNISQFASRIDGTLLMLITDQGAERQRVTRTFVRRSSAATLCV